MQTIEFLKSNASAPSVESCESCDCSQLQIAFVCELFERIANATANCEMPGHSRAHAITWQDAAMALRRRVAGAPLTHHDRASALAALALLQSEPPPALLNVRPGLTRAIQRFITVEFSHQHISYLS